MEGWKRFFHNISFDPEIIPTLWCDNQQTVSLVTKKADKLHTKLRHVDIHQNWVRQEVANGNLRVQWKPTAIMPADGLTKILPRQKQTEFIRQLGLVDVTKRLRNDARVEYSASPTPEALSRWYWSTQATGVCSLPTLFLFICSYIQLSCLQHYSWGGVLPNHMLSDHMISVSILYPM